MVVIEVEARRVRERTRSRERSFCEQHRRTAFLTTGTDRWIEEPTQEQRQHNWPVARWDTVWEVGSAGGPGRGEECSRGKEQNRDNAKELLGRGGSVTLNPRGQYLSFRIREVSSGDGMVSLTDHVGCIKEGFNTME